MKYGIIFVLALALGADLCLAGWERMYGGSSSDVAESVAQTSDGGYIIAGYTSSFGAGGVDVYLIKTTATGDTQWTRTYGGSGNDVGNFVAQTSDGGYIIAGYTLSFGDDSTDFYLIKTTATGDTQWTRTYGGSDYEGAYSVAQTSDGGYIIAGGTESFGAGGSDVYLVKTDALGDTIWTHTYGGSNNDIAILATQTSDGGYIIAGVTWSFGAAREDVYLIKTTVTGDTQWTHTYGGSDDEGAYSVAQTADSGYIIAGETESFGAGLGSDAYLIKTTATGDTQWTRTYGGSDVERAYSVAQTADGGYVLAGETMSFGGGWGVNVYIIKTTATGYMQWTRTYGGTYNDWANSVAQTSDGGYVVAGGTESFGVGGLDVYLIKTDSLGYTAIDESPFARPEDISLSAFPNPFNSACRISAPENAIVEIFNINGRCVAELPGGDQIWKTETSVDSGVYLIRAKIGGNDKGLKPLVTKRIVYLK